MPASQRIWTESGRPRRKLARGSPELAITAPEALRPCVVLAAKPQIPEAWLRFRSLALNFQYSAPNFRVCFPFDQGTLPPTLEFVKAASRFCAAAVPIEGIGTRPPEKLIRGNASPATPCSPTLAGMSSPKANELR